MAIQLINVGSSANSGGGDPLRNALIKVNENFTEVYAKLTALEDGSITTSITGDVKGSVYAEDSTLLVDGVNGNIPYSVLSGAPTIPTVLSDLAGDYTGSVFADDSTLLVDGVNGKIVGPVETNSVTATIDNLSLTADNYVIIDSNSNGQINIGQSSGVGNVVIGNRSNGTGVTISGNVNGLVYTKEESTGGSSTSTPTTISLTAVKNLYVLDSADTNDDSWLLPDGVEGQVIHLVPGTGAATNQHYVQIANWRRWDEGAGVAGEWRVETGLDWTPFVLENTTPIYRSMATAVFVNGAWHTDTPWID